MNFIDSNHSQTLAKAMDAYALRQKITSANIANADTPGYKRSEVRFEDQLQQAQATKKSGAGITPTIEVTEENVILEDEMIEMADTQMRVQLVSRSIRHHFDLLRTGITGLSR